MTDLQEKYASKIAALLRKAESTTPEEAELLLEKAQQLMARYSIEEAMIARAHGQEDSEQIVERRIDYKGSYHHGLYAIGSAIAEAQGCRVLIARSKNLTAMFVIGFESDVERAIMLDASVQIQMQVALRAAVKRKEVRSEAWMTAMQKFLERRNFMFGFAEGVLARLVRAGQIGRDEYRDEAIATGQDAETVATGMELVIRSRKDRINDWVDKQYGELRSMRSTTATGSGAARNAGRVAGRNADTGSAGRVGSRRQLGR